MGPSNKHEVWSAYRMHRNFEVYKFLWISWYALYPQKLISTLSKSDNDCTYHAAMATKLIPHEFSCYSKTRKINTHTVYDSSLLCHKHNTMY